MECPQVPVTSQIDFVDRIRRQAGGRRVPLSGTLEITARCNLHCAHCYINRPVEDRGESDRELRTAEIRRILDEVANEGCLSLLLTGGEPLVRADFAEIYSHAIRKGLLVTVFTNGTTITPRLADVLTESRPYSLEVTIYGRTRETFERVTGVPGSHEACLRGIELLLERRLPVKLKSSISRLNSSEIDGMKAFARECGVEFRFDPVLNVRLDGGRQPAELRLPPEEVVALDLADEERVNAWREFCERFIGVAPSVDDLYQCGAGLESFHIDAEGRLSACIMARQPSYDLRQGTFRHGWDDFLQRVRAQKWIRESPCRTCRLIALCGQCPGWGQLEHGDQESLVEYLCRIAHLRAKALEVGDA